MMTIDEIMTTDPITLAPDAALNEVGKLMLEHRIRHVPIVDGGNKLLGLVTQRDLLAAADDNSTQPTSSVMRTDLYTISIEDDMRAAGLLMQQHKIGSLPVMDGDKLVGIITDSDYVSFAINLLEQLDETNPLDNDDFDELGDVGGFKPDDQEF